jgi:hypothetical protein
LFICCLLLLSPFFFFPLFSESAVVPSRFNRKKGTDGYYFSPLTDNDDSLDLTSYDQQEHQRPNLNSDDADNLSVVSFVPHSSLTVDQLISSSRIQPLSTSNLSEL